MKFKTTLAQNGVIFSTYDDEHFFGYVKRRVYDFEELLAALGGFMGLIGGLSVISVIEIFYFILFKTHTASEPKSEETSKENFFKKTIMNFGNSSSIHGMNHASDQNRSNFEK